MGKKTPRIVCILIGLMLLTSGCGTSNSNVSSRTDDLTVKLDDSSGSNDILDLGGLVDGSADLGFGISSEDILNALINADAANQAGNSSSLNDSGNGGSGFTTSISDYTLD